MSSVISVSSAASVISNGEPLDDPVRVVSEQDLSQETSHHITTPGYRGKLFFDPGDGDLTLSICGTYFETHKYPIKKFSGLRSILCRLSPNAALHLKSDTCTAKDMENTLKVLYATYNDDSNNVLEGAFEFDHPTLVSALRVATLYDYPDLSAYTIKRLEQARLTAIERIKIAREFGLIAWEEPAYIELCERDEPITADEARVLGVDTFVKVANIRESEQRRRVNELGTQNKQQEAELKELKKAGGKSDGGGTKKPSSNEQDDSLPKPAAMQPSFVEVQTTGNLTGVETEGFTQMHLSVPGCSCKFDGYPSTDWVCTLPPCAVAAFKNLQIQQIAHTNSIANLQSFVDEHSEPSVELLPGTFTHCLKQPSVAQSVIPIHEEVHCMLNTLRSTCSLVNASQDGELLSS